MTFQGRKMSLKNAAIAFARSAILAPLALFLAPFHANATTVPALEPLVNTEFVQALAHASDDARYAMRWVLEAQDNQCMPFVIVDKKGARIFVFEGNGQIRGMSPALLGLTPGDSDVAGIAYRQVASLGIGERITPSGRFVSEPGRNLNGEAIVWFDYAAKLAIHRLRPALPQERRAERLNSATPDDKRISSGCVVVPERFYDAVISPVLGKSYAVVYVLPETQPVQFMLRGLQSSLRQDQ